MSGLSVALKRKSVQKVEPVLPRTLKIREPSASGRTFYENFKPAEVLKEFRKKQLYTYGNLSTQKSLSNLNTEDLVLKQSRFDDDHHNTESIQQLLDTKMVSNLPSSRTNNDGSVKKSLTNSQQKLTSQKESLESQNLANDDQQVLSRQKQQEKQKNNQQSEGEAKQGQNYDDYVLGDKIEQAEQQEQTKDKSFKKYEVDHNIIGAVESDPSIARADYIHFHNQRKRLLQLREDQEIVSLMQQYKNNKQVVLNQSTRRHQSHRIMAAISKAPQIQKSCSLPSIRAKREVEVPQVQSNYQDKMKRNILGKDTRKLDRFSQNQLLSSLSSGKLGFGRKKIRTICEQEIYQDEMNTLEEIKGKLRSKGITIDANKLTKGLVNIKNELQYQKVVAFPQKNIPSNPIYKKFPL